MHARDGPSSAQLFQVVLSQLEQLEIDPPSSPSSSHSPSKSDIETESVRSADTESNISSSVEITLNNKGITSLPLNVAEAIKHVVGKLSLQGNMLTTLPLTFLSMENLTYLDLSHNNFSTFPSVLTACPSLIILDLNSNSIDRLPRTVGNLDSLKILSLSNNKFQYLTPSVLDMVELVVIQVDGNPWVYPPKSIMKHPSSSHGDQSEWLEKLRAYLEDHADMIDEILEEQDASASPVLSAEPLESSLAEDTLVSENQPELKDITSLINWIKLSEAYDIPKDGDNPPEVPFRDASVELSDRSRSNSESVTSSRAAKRMGFIVKKNRSEEIHAPSFKTARDTISPTLPTFHARSSSNDKILPPPVRVHMRGLSHDSIMEPASHDRDDQSQTFQSSLQGSRARQRKLARERSHSASATTSPEKESKSGAYFRRLSTLKEENKPKSLKSITYLDIEKRVMQAARNILFALADFHSTMGRCSRLCNDKIISVKITEFLYAGKSYNDQLVSVLEKEELLMNSEEVSQEQSQKAITAIVNSCLVSISNFKQMARFCREYLYHFTSSIDIKFIRSAILVTYGCINELFNSWNILNDSVESSPRYPDVVTDQNSALRQVSNSSARSGELPFPTIITNNTSGSPLSSTFPTGSLNIIAKDFTEADNALYEGLEAAANAARTLLAQLTEAVSKSTVANSGTSRIPNPSVAMHVKALTSKCAVAVDVTRRLKERLEHVRKLPNLEVSVRKQFWDDMSAFLKGIIAILSTIKSAMNDLPYLKGTQSFTILTKLTKELPPLVDASSYKAMVADNPTQQQYVLQQYQQQQQAQLNQQIPDGNMLGAYSQNMSLTAPPATPLSAALGPAALAVMPSPPATKTFSHPSPFIPPAALDSSVNLLPNPSGIGSGQSGSSHSPMSPGGNKLSPAINSDGFL